MLRQVVLVPLLPLAGAVILLFFGKRLARVAGYLATVLVAASFGVSLSVLSGLAKLPGDQRLVVRHLFGWMAAGGFNVSVDFRIDPLSVMMILVVTGVGTLIHWYAVGYMAHDEGRVGVPPGDRNKVRNLRRRLILGHRGGVPPYPRGRRHRGGLLRRQDVQPDVQGRVLAPHRPRRGGTGGVRPL